MKLIIIIQFKRNLNLQLLISKIKILRNDDP